MEGRVVRAFWAGAGEEVAGLELAAAYGDGVGDVDVGDCDFGGVRDGG